jgi:hypothetical protein
MEISRRSRSEQAYLEYHGSTIVERIHMVNGMMPRREWLLFDTVEEAAEFYNENRAAA